MSSLGFSQIGKTPSNLVNNNGKFMNGRVQLPSHPPAPFELFQGETMETTKSYNTSTIANILETNPVNSLFFSSRNKEIIHKSIINEVYEKSNGEHKIGKQSEIHLTIIMRSIYLQYGKNLNCNIQQQVNELNRMVINDSVARILVEIEKTKKYNEFVAYLPEQIPLPTNPSQKGEKALYSKIG